MTSVKKIKVALLALVAALVIAIPTSAFAAGTIKVEAATGNDAALTANHVYDAYQVFAGTVTGDTLSNIEWGDGVNGAAILTAIKADSAFVVDGKNVFANASSAANVAQILEGRGDDSAFMQAFAKVVGANLTTKKAVEGFAAGTEVPVDDGYYLVMDGDLPEGADPTAATRFIMDVAGNMAVAKVKASVPTVEKGVLEDSTDGFDQMIEDGDISAYTRSADFDTNQPINYFISGTLPSTYNDYDHYYYKFTDKMSTGLEYIPGTAKIYIYNNGVQGDPIDEAEGKVVVNWTEPTLTVTIDDLKEYVEAYSADTTIVVLYQAKLNPEKAIKYGTPGNPNEVYLTFSNNPNSEKGGDNDTTDDTEKKFAVVFTYFIEDTKVDINDEEKTLAGAKFVLKNTKEDDEFFGKFASVKLDTGKSGKGVFVEWVDEAAATELVTEADGILNVRGLDAGSYQLIEKEAPANYVVGGPFDCTIDRDLPADSTVSFDNGGTVTVKEDLQADGGVHENLQNSQTASLPSTGGIGTTIFTIVGIALIVAAAAIMVVRRRNASAVQ